ncbi:sterol desaturase family protein [Rubripirellula lacrimiformis]|uniref:sterol desaturase family protein n=1 Tax=Rubripirellula lacrimiformis TaxID=1930273 RepID=UPI001FE56F2D|nr:sterol desaturase family protein [Rubripirellula lacrimiformis]
MYVCSVSSAEPFGLVRVVLSFLALDLFSYLWHRANHRFALLWRFHAVHHSDSAMDVTTAGRFHVVELGIAGIVRLPLLYLLGVSTTALLIYETALVMVSMMHHSTIALGRFDRIARTFFVTPSIHSVHHSRDSDLYACNYSSVLSVWDRLFRTFHLTRGPVQHGLDTHNDRKSVRSLLASPFHNDHNRGEQ